MTPETNGVKVLGFVQRFWTEGQSKLLKKPEIAATANVERI
jgi:hypothetical protein